MATTMNSIDLYNQRRSRSSIIDPDHDLTLLPLPRTSQPSRGRARSKPVLPQEHQIILTSRKSQDELRKVNRYSKHELPENLNPADIIAQIQVADVSSIRKSKSLEHIKPDSEFYQHREPDHGLTPHALYKEALYTGVHSLGRPTERYICTDKEMCMYANLAFRASQNEQKAVVEHVINEPFPLIVINAKIIKAEGLPNRDVHDQANPYCLVGLETEESAAQNENWQHVNFDIQSTTTANNSPATSAVKHKRLKQPEKRLDQNYVELPSSVKTSVQFQTSNPIWDEQFQCLALRQNEDMFTVEVWDHNDEKSTLHALKHAKDARKSHIVKGGMENLEEAFYRGKRDDFLGKVTVKINEIPCDGSEVWYNLRGVPHRGESARGRVLLQIWLTHAFRHGKHYEEYEEPRLTLSYLWDYILRLESKKDEGASHWDGKIPPAAKCLLFQYALQTGISESTQGSIQWKAYLKQNLDLDGLTTSLHHLKTTLVSASDEKLQEWKISELETTLLSILIERVCPILRNHLLGETQQRVHFAIETIQCCIIILKRFGCVEAIHRVNILVTTYIRLCILDWYEAKFEEIVTKQMRNVASDADLVQLYVLMIQRVNGILNEGLSIWNIMFWMDGFIDYMPIMYGELQKMVVFDVEDIVWRMTWRTYDGNNSMRLALLRFNAEDTKLSSYLFQLYHETQVFVLRPNEILGLEDKKFHTLADDYHRWFRPVLVLWLGFAFVKSCQMISKSIMIDNIIAEDEYVRTSSSALDTRVVFAQLSTFWTEMNWPDVAESFVILHFLMEVLAHVGLLYANLKFKKIDHEGYFDTIDRFDVSDRLCIALNNIETVKRELIHSFHNFKLEHLMKEMEDEMGEVETIKHQKHLEELMLAATTGIDEKVGWILNGIKERVKPEILDILEDYLIHLSRDPATRDVDSSLSKLLDYLEDNFVILQKRLLDTIFVPVLQAFWKAFCEDLIVSVRHFPLDETIFAQKEFFHEIENMVGLMMSYFRGGGGGLNEDEIYCDEYLHLKQFIELFQWETNELIGLYFHEKAREQFFPHPPTFGTLLVRASFWNGTLNVEVISGRNLVGSDILVSNYWPFSMWKSSKVKKTSDCMVQMDLVPENLFTNAKRQETTIQWNTTNPEYNESFSWLVTSEECKHVNAVLRFTMKDYDLLSKNDFIGQAFVPLASILGGSNAIKQPMNLFLRSEDNNNTTDNIVQILKCRRWETQAKQFVADEEERCVHERMF